VVAELKRAELRERGIMFKGQNVRAILTGEKTQTRRVMAPQPRVGFVAKERYVRSAFGRPGERLWVREAAYITPPGWGPASDCNLRDDEGRPRLVAYAADCRGGRSELAEEEYRLRKTPAMLFPRWACRVVLELTRVRVERLQAITEADIRAEGVTPAAAAELAGVGVDQVHGLREAWRIGWDAINGHKSAARWSNNPWVWVLEFRRLP